MAAVINALEDRNVDPDQITAFKNYVSANFSDLFVAGGNVNFPSLGSNPNEGSYNFAAWGLACPNNGRCDDGFDFSHGNGDSFHLDTADPYNGVGNALAHFGVDLILGNVVYWVLPR